MDAQAWDRRYAGTELVWSAEPNRFVSGELAGLPPGTALDLGCGEGRNAVWLAARGWDVVAVDFSAVALDKGRRVAERAGVHVRWVCADVLAPLPGTTGPDAAPGDGADSARVGAGVGAGQRLPTAYDVVLLAYLQLPAEQRRAAHERAAAALAPGGTLLVVAHDRSNLTEGVGGPPDPAVLATVPEVLDDLRSAGLRTVRAERVHRRMETRAGPRAAVDLLVRCERPR